MNVLDRRGFLRRSALASAAAAAAGMVPGVSFGQEVFVFAVFFAIIDDICSAQWSVLFYGLAVSNATGLFGRTDGVDTTIGTA